MENFIGFILPAVIDLLNRKITDTDIRFWVAAVFCALVGVGVNYVANGNHLGTLDSIFTSIMMIFGEAQLSYKGIWENSKVRSTIGLNAKTQV